MVILGGEIFLYKLLFNKACNDYSEQTVEALRRKLRGEDELTLDLMDDLLIYLDEQLPKAEAHDTEKILDRAAPVLAALLVPMKRKYDKIVEIKEEVTEAIEKVIPVEEIMKDYEETLDDLRVFCRHLGDEVGTTVEDNLDELHRRLWELDSNNSGDGDFTSSSFDSAPLQTGPRMDSYGDGGPTLLLVPDNHVTTHVELEPTSWHVNSPSSPYQESVPWQAAGSGLTIPQPEPYSRPQSPWLPLGSLAVPGGLTVQHPEPSGLPWRPLSPLLPPESSDSLQHQEPWQQTQESTTLTLTAGVLQFMLQPNITVSMVTPGGSLSSSRAESPDRSLISLSTSGTQSPCFKYFSARQSRRQSLSNEIIQRYVSAKEPDAISPDRTNLHPQFNRFPDVHSYRTPYMHSARSSRRSSLFEDCQDIRRASDARRKSSVELKDFFSLESTARSDNRSNRRISASQGSLLNILIDYVRYQINRQESEATDHVLDRSDHVMEMQMERSDNLLERSDLLIENAVECSERPRPNNIAIAV